MNEYEKNVYKNIFEYPTKKIVELELENENQRKQLEEYENMRKEAIDYLKENSEMTNLQIYGIENVLSFRGNVNDLLNILNKVGGDNE
jgi:hypothetical protein